MIPKKPKEIIKQVSEELDMPQTMVDDIVTLYFKSLRKSLSNLEHLNVLLPGLGHFRVRPIGVKKAIKKFESMNNGMTEDTFMHYHNKKIVLARLEKLYAINDRIAEFIENKKAFKDGKYSNKDLEQS